MRARTQGHTHTRTQSSNVACAYTHTNTHGHIHTQMLKLLFAYARTIRQPEDNTAAAEQCVACVFLTVHAAMIGL